MNSETANPQYQYNKTTLKIKGSPKEIICTKYEQYAPTSEFVYYLTKQNLKFDIKGNIIEEEDYSLIPEDNRKKKFSYDNANNRVYYEFYNMDGSLVAINIYYLTKYGNLAGVEEQKEKGIVNWQQNYQYTVENDTLAKYEVYSSMKGGENKLQYSVEVMKKNGKPILQNSFFEKEQSSTYVYGYDVRGNNTSILSYSNRDTSNWESKTNMRYDTLNRMIFQENLTQSNSYRTYFDYDNNDNIIKQTRYQNDSILPKESFRFEYLYDEQHNWIQRIQYFENGKKHSLLERKIIYY